MKSTKYFLAYLPSMVCVGLIAYITWFPHPIGADMLPVFPMQDKLIHAIMMGGLLGAVLFDYKRADRSRKLSEAVVLRFALVVVAFGLLDEIIQGALPIERPFDFFDVLADWFGTVVAYFAAPPAVNAVLRRRS